MSCAAAFVPGSIILGKTDADCVAFSVVGKKTENGVAPESAVFSSAPNGDGDDDDDVDETVFAPPTAAPRTRRLAGGEFNKTEGVLIAVCGPTPTTAGGAC